MNETYAGPPVPVIEGICAQRDMSHYCKMKLGCNLTPTNLDMLIYIYVLMHDRCAHTVVRWHQRTAPQVDHAVIEETMHQVRLLNGRERGRPKAARTIKHFFKESLTQSSGTDNGSGAERVYKHTVQDCKYDAWRTCKMRKEGEDDIMRYGRELC